MADSISAIPQQPFLGRLAEFLRLLEKDRPEFLPRQLGVMQGISQLALPQASTIENLSYGNQPFTMPPSGTGAMIPQVKTGRKTEVADLISMISGVPGAGAVADVGTKLSNETADALVRMITRNPQATAPSVIQETAMPFMQAVAPKSIHDEYYNLTAKANELYSKLRSGGMDKDVLDEYKAVRARRDELQTQVFPEPLAEPTPTGLLNQSYQGQHTAPMKDSGAPLWKLEDVYPEDFYSSLGARYYGDGAEPARDARLVSLIQSFRNHPDRPVTIYRAIPKDIDAKINVGDWVTLDRQYAKEHGQSALNNNYKIVRKTVKARDLFTNGDSIYEFGYDPQPFIPKRKKPE